MATIIIKKEDNPNENAAIVPTKDVEDMLKAGVHFGHTKAKSHPKMGKFLYGTRNTVYLIDVIKTQECFDKAIEFLTKVKAEGKKILFVGTKISAQDLTKDLAIRLQMPYQIEKWIGGTITNFSEVRKRLDYLQGLKDKKAKGEFEKYIKKERIKIEEEMQKIERKMGGMSSLKALPDVLFVVDAHKEEGAIKEAHEKHIPVVAICDTDADPSKVDYPIPANDDAISSLQFIFTRLSDELQATQR